MWNSCTSVFQTLADGHSKNEISKRKRKKGKKRGVSMESKAGTKEKSRGHTVAQGSLCPEAVDKLPHPLPPLRKNTIIINIICYYNI